MINANKSLAAVLVGILAVSCASLLTVQPANAQSIPIPSVPEFTVRFAQHPFDIPSNYTTTINPYTGEEKVTRTFQGYTVENKSIDILIHSQQVSGLNSSQHIYYNVRVRPHYAGDWIEIYPWHEGLEPQNLSHVLFLGSNPIQSDSEYTVLSYSSDWEYTFPVLKSAMEQPNATLDFQVQAIIGYDSWEYISDHPLAPIPVGSPRPAIAVYSNSSWSPTQTLTIPAKESAAPTPTVPELPWWVIAPVLVSLLFIAALYSAKTPPQADCRTFHNKPAT